MYRPDAVHNSDSWPFPGHVSSTPPSSKPCRMQRGAPVHRSQDSSGRHLRSFSIHSCFLLVNLCPSFMERGSQSACGTLLWYLLVGSFCSPTITACSESIIPIPHPNIISPATALTLHSQGRCFAGLQDTGWPAPSIALCAILLHTSHWKCGAVSEALQRPALLQTQCMTLVSYVASVPQFPQL